MADILTQLQTCLDQLATQFYATLGYLTTYHDNSPAIQPQVPDAAPALAKITKNSTAHPVPANVASQSQGQASPPPPGQTGGGSAAPETPGGKGDGGAGGVGGGGLNDPLAPAPDLPSTFASRQRELARDLIIKEQQIEYLISVLPGIGSSEKEQEIRLKELEGELRTVEEERERKVRELRGLRRKLEGVLGGVEMGIYGER
ncbi:med21 domain-containing protein [Aspergillus ruber CBS 135680]|uniref:Mediator of RNA polymerase II transcription subunit 21 n=1 Tax=Aspergillus ruber (strain CBS 135680) TaxID=1388766 RepID=A0A017SMD6_ASPRC|nr:uncharacterized protein EURHEDRAFT_375622 [Aspergillus ruber CBS 135680]EYE97804.1 hypothetical protein EURHEDRAFT_375622 [Aspergillus ruber CBS 135680]